MAAFFDEDLLSDSADEGADGAEPADFEAPKFAAADEDRNSATGAGNGSSGAGSHDTSVMTPLSAGRKKRGCRGGAGKDAAISKAQAGAKPDNDASKRWRSGAIPTAPVFDGDVEGNPYCLRQYRRRLWRWVRITREFLPPNEQALRALEQLRGDAELELEEVEDSRYDCNDGISVLLRDLETSFGERELFRQGGTIREYESIGRLQGESVNAFIRRFRLLERKMQESKVPAYPEAARVVKLLDGLRLEERSTAQILLAAGNKYEMKGVLDALRVHYPPGMSITGVPRHRLELRKQQGRQWKQWNTTWEDDYEATTEGDYLEAELEDQGEYQDENVDDGPEQDEETSAMAHDEQSNDMQALLSAAQALTVTSKRLAGLVQARGFYQSGKSSSGGMFKGSKGRGKGGKSKGKGFSSKGAGGKGNGHPASGGKAKGKTEQGKGAKAGTPLHRSRLKGSLCLGCGSPDHWIKDCPSFNVHNAQVSTAGIELDAEGNVVAECWMVTVEPEPEKIVRLPALSPEDASTSDFAQLQDLALEYIGCNDKMTRNPSVLLNYHNFQNAAFMIADTGCQRQVAGQAWHNQKALEIKPLQALALDDSCHFSFGPGRPLRSQGRFAYPAAIGGEPLMLCVSSVEASAPALLSRKAFESLGAVPDVYSGTIYFRALDKSSQLWLSPCGHLSIRIDEWPEDPFAWPLFDVPPEAPDAIHPAAYRSTAALKKIVDSARLVPHAFASMADQLAEHDGPSARVRDDSAADSPLLLSHQPEAGPPRRHPPHPHGAEYCHNYVVDECSDGSEKSAQLGSLHEGPVDMPTSFRWVLDQKNDMILATPKASPSAETPLNLTKETLDRTTSGTGALSRLFATVLHALASICAYKDPGNSGFLSSTEANAGRQWHGTASTASNVSEERMSVDPEPENPEDWTQEDAWHLWHGTEFEDNLEGSEPGELFDPNNHIPDVDAYGNVWLSEMKVYELRTRRARSMRKYGVDVVEIYVDAIYDLKLHGPRDYDLLQELLLRHRSFLTIYEIPCTAWSRVQHLNYDHQELQQLRQRQHGAIEAMVKTILALRQEGCHFLIENPAGTPFWDHPALRRLRSVPGAAMRTGHMCRFGLADKEGRLLKKPTAWLSDLPEVLNSVALECQCEPQRAHGRCLGGQITRSAQVYTPKLCEAVVDGLQASLTAQGDERLCRSSAQGNEDDVAEVLFVDVNRHADAWKPLLQEAEERLRGKAAMSAIVKAATPFFENIRTLVPWELMRVQISRTPMVRRLPIEVISAGAKHRGVVLHLSDDSIRIEAEAIKPILENSASRFASPVRTAIFFYGTAPDSSLDPTENLQPESKHVPSASRAKQTEELDGADALLPFQAGYRDITFPGLDRETPKWKLWCVIWFMPALMTMLFALLGIFNVRIFGAPRIPYAYLNQVDSATSYQALAYLANRTEMEVLKVLVNGWFTFFGYPDQLLLDAEGAFKGYRFESLQAQCGVKLAYIPADAHHQLGHAERHGQAIRYVVRALVSQFAPTSTPEMNLVVSMATAAKNSLMRRSGSAPSQWVFGRLPRLPGALLSTGGTVEACQLLEDSERLRQIESVRAEAMAQYIRFEYDSTLRAALLRKGRPFRGPFEVGQRVAYYRARNQLDGQGTLEGYRQGVIVALDGPNGNLCVRTLRGRLVLCSREQCRVVPPHAEEEWWQPGQQDLDLLKNFEEDLPRHPLAFRALPRLLNLYLLTYLWMLAASPFWMVPATPGGGLGGPAPLTLPSVPEDKVTSERRSSGGLTSELERLIEAERSNFKMPFYAPRALRSVMLIIVMMNNELSVMAKALSCARCGCRQFVTNPAEVLLWFDEVQERQAFDAILPAESDKQPLDDQGGPADAPHPLQAQALKTDVDHVPPTRRLDVLRRHARGAQLQAGWDGTPHELQPFFENHAFLNTAHIYGAHEEQPGVTKADPLLDVLPEVPWGLRTDYSVSVSHNVRALSHRDYHNAKDSMNYHLTLGEHKGGRLWVQADDAELTDPDGVVWRTINGKRVAGYYHDAFQQVLEFSPSDLHETEKFVGDRWSITAYTTRSIDTARLRDLHRLRQLGFSPVRHQGRKLRKWLEWSTFQAYPLTTAAEGQDQIAMETSGDEGDDGGHVHEASRAKKQALKKELPWKAMTPEERPSFVAAVKAEWQEWLKWSSCHPVKMKPGAVDRSLILKSRLCYRWKPKAEEEGKYKAKARLVVAGFADPHLPLLTRDSPVLSRAGFMLLLQWSCSQKVALWNGDCRSAFLQGRPDDERPTPIFMAPPKDPIALEAIPEWNDTTLLYKLSAPVYGQSNAPRRWYLHVVDVMEGLNWTRHTLDPCLFLYRDNDAVVAVLGIHVDDVITAALDGYAKVLDEVHSKFEWGSPWVSRDFKFVGRRIKQREDGTITIDQEGCVAEVPLTKTKLEPSTPLQHRLGDGVPQWHRVFTVARWDHQGYVRATQDSFVRIHPVNLTNLLFICYGDSGWGNAYGGKSQGGLLVVATDDSVYTEPRSGSILEWKSYRHQRVLRSTLAAEACALDRAQDYGNYLALMFSEMTDGQFLATHNARPAYPVIPVTDSRSVWDSVHRMSTTFAEKRVEVDIAGLRESCRGLRWVPTEQQKADCLTKRSKTLRDEFRKFLANPLVTLTEARSAEDMLTGQANAKWR
ncbi:unnamed protein product [Symbiodinium sp. KB8]|nr:unnamed protein product [Symbiodinium sp. KB8]